MQVLGLLVGLALIPLVATGAWKGSNKPPTPVGGWNKSQEVRERAHLSGTLPENEACLWERVEVQKAGRMPGSLV